MSEKSTKNNDGEKGGKHRLFTLQGYHYRAIELRYAGKTFREICGTIAVDFKKGVHPDTIQKWFARKGLLHEEYMTYARAENDQRRLLMREELKKLLTQIPAKLQEIMNRKDSSGQPDMVALMGVKTIMETLGVTANDDTKTNDVLKDYFEKLDKLPARSAVPAAPVKEHVTP